MVETRAAVKLLSWLAIVIISLLGHSMNAEATALPSGIEGTVTVSPIHGGPLIQGEAGSAPMADTNFLVETAGGKIRTFKTDAEGKFRVELPPGKYAIRIQQAMMKGRGCGLADIEVTGASFKKVRIDCDSGMR